MQFSKSIYRLKHRYFSRLRFAIKYRCVETAESKLVSETSAFPTQQQPIPNFSRLRRDLPLETVILDQIPGFLHYWGMSVEY